MILMFDQFYNYQLSCSSDDYESAENSQIGAPHWTGRPIEACCARASDSALKLPLMVAAPVVRRVARAIQNPKTGSCASAASAQAVLQRNMRVA